MSDNNEPTLSDDQADDQDRQSIKTPMARRQADKDAALLAADPDLTGSIFSDEPNDLTSDIDPAASLCIRDGQASPADHDFDVVAQLATSLADFNESTLTELASPTNRTDGASIIIAGRDSLQDTVNQVGQEVTRRNLDIQPTLTQRPGLPLRVIVNRDLVLRPYQPFSILQRNLQ